MYAAAAGQVDHELYLLGKAVDKAVDPMAQDDEEVCEKLEAMVYNAQRMVQILINQ